MREPKRNSILAQYGVSVGDDVGSDGEYAALDKAGYVLNSKGSCWGV